MIDIQRLLVTNRIQAPATVLGASASAIGSPVSRLKDQLRSKTWRSPVGWTIVTGCNDRIDFNRGGVKAATIAAGTYVTGAAKAAAVVAALEAADPTPAWGADYGGGAGANKFGIFSDMAFSLLFGSGANFSRSVHLCMGFTSTDKGSGTSHASENVSYQSRKMLTADCGSALGDTVAIVINHNAGTGGTFTFQMDAASLAAVGYGDTSTPDFSTTLPGNADIRIAYFAEQTKRYRRLLINDVQNPLGYAEVGIWYAGPYRQLTISYAIGFEKKWEELSEVTVAISGAHFQDEKARRPTWEIQWSGMEEADRAAVAAAFALVPKGRNFFFAFDAGGAPADTEYVYIPEGVSEKLMRGLYYEIPVALAGALG